MRRWLPVAFAIAAASLVRAQAPLRFVNPRAGEWVQRTRAAVSSRAGAAEIRTLLLKGRVRVPGEGDAMTDGTLEIRIALPDRFARIDTIGSIERWTGFSGTTLLNAGAANKDGELRAERVRLLRLLLGVGAMVPGDQPVSVEAVDESAFPDTNNLDVTSGSWSARLVLDAESWLPLRIVDWAGARGATIMSFADRRSVDGVLIPHRITTTTAERVLESLMFDEVQINPALTDAAFKPPRG